MGANTRKRETYVLPSCFPFFLAANSSFYVGNAKKIYRAMCFGKGPIRCFFLPERGNGRATILLIFAGHESRSPLSTYPCEPHRQTQNAAWEK